jgi:hypothetical protein
MIQGLRHVGNFTADERPKNWREGILRLYPNGKAPLTALTSAMKDRSVNDPEYNWFEKQLPAQRLKIGANLTDIATSLTITNDVTGDGKMFLTTAKQLKKGHLLRIEQTGEIVRVSADPSSATSVSITRAFGETAAAAIANIAGAGVNPYASVVGTAYEENSSAPTGINYNSGKQYNYTQIFRNTLEMSRTAQKTRLRTGDQVKEAKREALELHSIEMEKAFWFGERFEGTENGNPIRQTRGIQRWIAANAPANVIAKAGAATDLDTLEGWMEQMFRYGSSEKMAFCGNAALLTIGKIVRKNSSWDLSPGEEYKMKVSRLTTPFGELVLKSHPLFNQMFGGTTGGSAYYNYHHALMVLDMANISYVYLEGSDTKYEPKYEDNGVDGMKSGYITEAGLEVHHPESHFIITGLATAAKDS